MSRWSDVFDNEEVQRDTRRQVTHVSGVVVAAVMVTVAGIGLALADHRFLPPVGFLLLLAWTTTIGWISRRLRRLRRIVWCVKLSDERIVGYDYMRNQTLLHWAQAERIDLITEGLSVTGPDRSVLHIPHAFPEFAQLSHCILHYARRYDVPIYIDGQRWEDIDVYQLFPFLADDPSAGAHGGSWE